MVSLDDTIGDKSPTTYTYGNSMIYEQTSCYAQSFYFCGNDFFWSGSLIYVPKHGWDYKERDCVLYYFKYTKI